MNRDGDVMKRRFLRAALVLLMAGSSTLYAHHPTTRVYRMGEVATIDGVIVSLVIKSPHSYIHVQAPDRSNKLRTWAIECGDSRALRRHVDAHALKVGDRVVVTGDPAVDEGLWRLRLRKLIRPADGWQWNEPLMSVGAR